MASTGQRNQLTHEEFYRLTEMLRQEAEWFMRTKPSWTGAAKYLTDKLGFTVTPHHVKNVSRITNVVWDAKPTHRVTKIQRRIHELEEHFEELDSTMKHDLQKLINQVDGHHGDIQRVVGFVKKLYDNLGLEFAIDKEEPQPLFKSNGQSEEK